MDYREVISILQDMVARSDGDEFIALRSAIDAVIQVRAFMESDRWIPVEDALPEVHQYVDDGAAWDESDDVLICDKRGNMFVANWEVDSEYAKYWVDEGGMEFRDVVAWQPLPKPYEGVTE